jgi:hypothetical protein
LDARLHLPVDVDVVELQLGCWFAIAALASVSHPDELLNCTGSVILTIDSARSPACRSYAASPVAYRPSGSLFGLDNPGDVDGTVVHLLKHLDRIMRER